MKLFKTFLAVTICAAAFAACNSTPSPTEVFKQQNEAQKKKDVATMKQNLSKASLDLIEKTAKAQNKTLDEALAMETPASADQPAAFETRNEKISGDTATLEAKVPNGDQWITMPFVKEDGRWKIALDKLMQDLMKQMSEQMPQTAPADSPANADGNTGAANSANANANSGAGNSTNAKIANGAKK